MLLAPHDVSNRPLGWLPAVVTADWPAALEAGRLLRYLGAKVTASAGPWPALACGSVIVDSPQASVFEDWDASGVSDITGRRDGPPLTVVGRPATVARAALLAYELITAILGQRVRFDVASLLSQRIQFGDRTRRGDVSFGGSARLMRSADGWWALNLPRESDLKMVPALVEHPVEDDPWISVTDWARERTSTEVVERALLLGLAVGELRSPSPPGSPWNSISPRSVKTLRTQKVLRVVNFGALWAGPLCAHLLSRFGTEVIDVESETRPDGARRGHPHFYNSLHRGNDLVTIDFASESGRRSLHELVQSADVVIESSRPRAFRELGLVPSTMQANGTPRIWIQITGHGRHSPHRIAFGDDAAVDGGLVAFDANGPVFAGDAIADPLAGAISALSAVACIGNASTSLIEVSLRTVAAYCATLNGTGVDTAFQMRR